jgi:hypothetical protein
MNNQYNKTYYFIYQGTAYAQATKVKFKKATHLHKWHTTVGANDTYVFYLGCDGQYVFHWVGPEERRMCYRGQMWITNCDMDIEEIVEPIYPQWISWQQQAIQNMSDKNVCTDVFGGVLIYIVIMCIGAIFDDRLTIWLVSTAIFSCWLLNQYRT